ncbi:MAG: iron transporter [Haloplanus sp.]
MRRRRYLALAGTAGVGSLAGCSDLIETRSATAPPLVENRPDAVYYPSHVEQMKTSGVKTKRGYTCALTYTYPHRFWLVTGTHTNRVKIKPNDAVHVMPVLWDAETGQRLSDVAPKMQVSRAGEQVLSNSPWPMLSQPMGWHFGDNVQLPKEGTYDVTVRVGSPSAKRTGSLEAAPERATFAFEFEYSRDALDEIPWHKLPEKKGTPGAVAPMEMEKIPPATVPKKSALPGTVFGEGTSGDATFVLTVLDDATDFGGSSDQSYLAVSPRSPYNRYVLPMMGLSLTQRRGSSRVTNTGLTETLDPDLSLHYGTVLDGVQSGDTVTIHVDTPPQFARHEGYETAFVEMPDVTTTV